MSKFDKIQDLSIPILNISFLIYYWSIKMYSNHLKWCFRLFQKIGVTWGWPYTIWENGHATITFGILLVDGGLSDTVKERMASQSSHWLNEVERRSRSQIWLLWSPPPPGISLTRLGSLAHRTGWPYWLLRMLPNFREFRKLNELIRKIYVWNHIEDL